jgi:phenylpropionate dioxygenase-like ring-hydroxylating dioxygenase large terminal subunit
LQTLSPPAPAATSPRRPIDYRALIEQDRVHGSLYTDPAVFDDEMDRIFGRGWAFVGHDSEVPKPGDYITRTVGREPLLMLRTREGAVRVFANRCTHRGNKICSREKGTTRSLVCDYHGWAFTLDGELRGVPYAGGFHKDRATLGLRSPARVEAYQGFVFASLNPDAPPLKDHLGKAAGLIDRLVSLSPVGRIRLDAGWVKQQFFANWKMLPENDTDGYHAGHVHRSFLQVFRSQYDVIQDREEDRKSEVVDWGNGHTAIDAAKVYSRPLEWLGTTREKAADYCRLMDQAYGEDKARQMLTDGPPHAVVFPNLFLGEMNIVIFQPVSAGECVQWHTPVYLEGAPDDVNRRILRQSEAAMGPSAFLLADDQVISERQQLALQGGSGWLDISRGLEREWTDEHGARRSHISDETTNRGFWQHYLQVMTQP